MTRCTHCPLVFIANDWGTAEWSRFRHELADHPTEQARVPGVTVDEGA